MQLHAIAFTGKIPRKWPWKRLSGTSRPETSEKNFRAKTAYTIGKKYSKGLTLLPWSWHMRVIGQNVLVDFIVCAAHPSKNARLSCLEPTTWSASLAAKRPRVRYGLPRNGAECGKSRRKSPILTPKRLECGKSRPQMRPRPSWFVASPQVRSSASQSAPSAAA